MIYFSYSANLQTNCRLLKLLLYWLEGKLTIILLSINTMFSIFLFGFKNIYTIITTNFNDFLAHINYYKSYFLDCH